MTKRGPAMKDTRAACRGDFTGPNLGGGYHEAGGIHSDRTVAVVIAPNSNPRHSQTGRGTPGRLLPQCLAHCPARCVARRAISSRSA